jgi:hypothetical protein
LDAAPVPGADGVGDEVSLDSVDSALVVVVDVTFSLVDADEVAFELGRLVTLVAECALIPLQM